MGFGIGPEYMKLENEARSCFLSFSPSFLRISVVWAPRYLVPQLERHW